MSYKSEYAHTATIAVHSATPEYKDFAHRVYRDLVDRGYQVFFEPENKMTLTVIVSWTDAFGWSIQYNNKVKSAIFRSLDHFFQALRSDFLLANQPWVPLSMVRPF